MLGKRIQILVEVNMDPVPGWGNDPFDYVKLIEKMLSDRIPHYNPVVTLLEENVEEEATESIPIKYQDHKVGEVTNIIEKEDGLVVEMQIDDPDLKRFLTDDSPISFSSLKDEESQEKPSA